MKLYWRIVRKMLIGLGAAISYGSPIAKLLRVSFWGLSWEWYTLIGVSILTASLLWIIADLHSENKELKSEDKELWRKDTKLRIEKYEGERIDVELIGLSKPKESLEDNRKKHRNDNEV